jgi:hypothetical protein
MNNAINHRHKIPCLYNGQGTAISPKLPHSLIIDVYVSIMSSLNLLVLAKLE